jgi:hypothetical protein
MASSNADQTPPITFDVRPLLVLATCEENGNNFCTDERVASKAWCGDQYSVFRWCTAVGRDTISEPVTLSELAHNFIIA